MKLDARWRARCGRFTRYLLRGGLVSVIGILAFGSVRAETKACAAVDGLIPLCIGHAAEDIEALPDQRHLLLSNYGGVDGTPGTLVLLDTQTLRKETLYPVPGDQPENDAPAWGEHACAKPVGTSLSPHGLHLSRRDDGRMQLLVVNHGGRESIELFEVQMRGDNYRLQWRGCVVGPVGSLFNDVAALPGNGFVVTQMFDTRDPSAMQRAASGAATGHVLRWLPQAGFSTITGSEGSIPNGVQSTPDGKTLFVNYSGANELRRIDLQDGTHRSVSIRQPDNISWTHDGRLLAISLQRSMSFDTCVGLKTGFCDVPFAVYAIDPQAMTTQKIFAHAGVPFGASTVAVQMGPSIYLGSFAGDRIAKFSLAPAESKRADSGSGSGSAQ